MEKKTVKCPKCNTHLAVTNSKNEEQKIISCPRCGTKLRVRFAPKQQGPLENDNNKTILPDLKSPKPAVPPIPPIPPIPSAQPKEPMQQPLQQPMQPLQPVQKKPEPVAQPKPEPKPCTMALIYEGVRYNLLPGQNRIGRKSKTVNADVQLNISDPTISRYNALIEISETVDGNFKAVISNGQNKNPLYVNDLVLNETDKVILHDGDVVKMGQTSLLFVTY